MPIYVVAATFHNYSTVHCNDAINVCFWNSVVSNAEWGGVELFFSYFFLHWQGSKILQIFSRLEGYVEESPFIICTSNPTEYSRDLATRHHFAEIPLGMYSTLLYIGTQFFTHFDSPPGTTLPRSRDPARHVQHATL